MMVQSQPGGSRWNSVKVFTATVAHEREILGDRVTSWLRAHPAVKPIETVVTQSSDEAFHCIAITLFYWEERTPA